VGESNQKPSLGGVWVFSGSTELFYDVDVKRACRNSVNSKENLEKIIRTTEK